MYVALAPGWGSRFAYELAGLTKQKKYVCVYMCVYVYMHIRIYECMHVCTHVCLDIHMLLYACMCGHVCLHAYLICISSYVFVCVRVYMYVYPARPGVSWRARVFLFLVSRRVLAFPGLPRFLHGHWRLHTYMYVYVHACMCVSTRVYVYVCVRM